MNNGMRLFLLLLTVKAYSHSTLASGFAIRQSKNNDSMVVATTDDTNKTPKSKTSRLMRRFCELYPYHEWCRTNNNPNTTPPPTTTNHLETKIDVNNTTPNKIEVIEINTNFTSDEFGNETTDGNLNKHESTDSMVSSTETSPTTTVINNWPTREDDSFRTITFKEASETTPNDYDESTILTTTDSTDDAVSTPTTPESTTNYEPDSTAFTTTKVLHNVTVIETPASTEFSTTNEVVDNVTHIETTTSVPTNYTNFATASAEFKTSTKVLDNETLVETTTSILTDYTKSTITSTKLETTTEVLNNVTLIGTTTAVPTRHINIYNLISFIIKQIIMYFCNCFELNDILFY